MFLFSLYAESSVVSASGYRHLIDANKTYTVQTIASKRDLFVESPSTSFSYPKVIIWNNFILKNSSNSIQEVVITNEQHTTREVDVLLIRDTGKTETFFAGASRPLASQQTKYRYPSISVQLNPHEEITVFVRYNSPTSIDTKWRVYDENDFLHKTTIDTLIWGIAIGALLVMIAYNISIYFSIKDPVYLFYSFMTLGALLYQPSINGVYYMFSEWLASFTLTMANTVSSFMIVFIFLFTIFFFNLKQNAKTLYKVYLALIVTGLLFAIISFLGIFIDYRIASTSLYAIFISSSLLLVLSTGFLAIYKKLPGAFYFTAGTGFYAVSLIFLTMYLSGKSTNQYFLSFVPLAGNVSDMVFLSLALARKIAAMDAERRKANGIMLEHAKFISIGQILAGMIHQLKQPVTYLGAITARLEMIFEENDKHIAQEDKSVAADLQKVVSSMDDTIMKFYDLYAKEKEPTRFLIYRIVEDSINILSPEISARNIEIKKRFRKNDGDRGVSKGDRAYRNRNTPKCHRYTSGAKNPKSENIHHPKTINQWQNSHYYDRRQRWWDIRKTY